MLSGEWLQAFAVNLFRRVDKNMLTTALRKMMNDATLQCSKFSQFKKLSSKAAFRATYPHPRFLVPTTNYVGSGG